MKKISTFTLLFLTACSTHARLESLPHTEPSSSPKPKAVAPSSAPSGSPSPYVDTPTNPSTEKTKLEGTWKIDCRQRLSITLDFVGNEYRSDATVFQDDACTKIFQQKSQKGTFTIGAEVDAIHHVFAIDTEYKNSAGTMIKSFDIFQVDESGQLRFSARPGQSAATRPLVLRADLVYKR